MAAEARPNLASQALGLAMREPPAIWERKWGLRPLLAETFCDIERTAGTCYRAAGWEVVGKTKGFPRVKDGKGSGVSPLGPSGWQGTISSADSGAEVDGKESPI